MENFNNIFKKEDLICSYNFARNANVVYSEVLLKSQFNKLNIRNPVIIYEDADFIFYKLKEFELSENNIIFCNLYMVDSLFNLMRDKIHFKNIKLITGQSDRGVNKKLFLKKPECISQWYATNVHYSHKNLIPIPLGLANDHPKNLSYINYINNNNLITKDEIAYMNFEENTNFFKRTKIKNKLCQKDWVHNEDRLLPLDDYLTKLRSSMFIISPPGNGADTHRVWEAIYAGSYPIVEKSIAMNSFTQFPIIFVKKIANIKKERIKLLKNNLNELNIDTLKVSYWIKKIDEKKLDSFQEKLIIKDDEASLRRTLSEYDKKIKSEQKIKKFKTINRRIYSKLFK